MESAPPQPLFGAKQKYRNVFRFLRVTGMAEKQKQVWFDLI